ncbi:hypothetical protein HPB50_013788 [Hyalomma asiaticum]|uniref:Uncharacterized protein n=1 Tax=Hyalomma asiaticum TaxID=266040 RepID=A0ACB7THW1_HYAAI|nr:hypothetical protein HPB50_013788 [Hyalomma asiaticum]
MRAPLGEGWAAAPRTSGGERWELDPKRRPRPWLYCILWRRDLEAIDGLAKSAHSANPPISTAVTAGDFTRHRLRRHLQARHPDRRVAIHRPPRPLSHCCACGSAAGRQLDAAGWACRRLRDAPPVSQPRSALQEAYRTLGLPSKGQKDILFPDRNLGPLLQSLVEYLDSTGLSSNL